MDHVTTVNHYGVRMNVVRNSLMFDSGPGVGMKGLLLNADGSITGPYHGAPLQLDNPGVPKGHGFLDVQSRDPWSNDFCNDYGGPGHNKKIHWVMQMREGPRAEGFQVAVGEGSALMIQAERLWTNDRNLLGRNPDFKSRITAGMPVALIVAGERMWRSPNAASRSRRRAYRMLTLLIVPVSPVICSEFVCWPMAIVNLPSLPITFGSGSPSWYG